MKSFRKWFFLISCILVLMGIMLIFLVACGESAGTNQPSSTHEHTYSDIWSHDQTYHWHESTCEHKLQKDKIAHNWDGGVITTPATETSEGVKTYTCTICGATKTETAPQVEKQKTTITFNLNGGTSPSSTAPVEVETLDGSVFFFDVTKDGYNFRGWSCNGTKVFDENGNKVGDIPLQSAMTFVAQFSNTAKLTITTNMPEAGTYSRGGEYNYNENVDLTNQKTQIVNGSTGDLTLYAKWTPTVYTITYELNGGTNSASNPNAYTVESAKITYVTPTREGYAFAGWYTDSACTQSTTGIASGSHGNLTVYAKWNISYTITYELNGYTGSEGFPSTYTVESEAITIGAPTRDGYTFMGWSGSDLDGLQLQFVIPQGSTGDRAYTANWSINTYSITYVLNDGVIADDANPSSYTYEDRISLVEPTREEDMFLGWYDGDTLVAELYHNYHRDLVLVAVWGDYELVLSDNMVTGIITNDIVDSVVIPTHYRGTNITAIGDTAFRDCTWMTSITIPDSVITIGAGAFSGCSALESITIPFVGAVAGKTSSDTYQYPFGYIFGTTSYTGGTEITQKYYGSSTSSLSDATYYIPTGLRSVTVTGANILYGAFYACSDLTSITIPDSVTTIESCAFHGCSGLTSIVIPDSVTSIKGGAFSGCSSLESITLPFVGGNKNATKASSSTLFGYIFGKSSYTGGKATQQYLPNKIIYYTYYIPTSLRNVTVTGGNKLYDGAFSGCSGLTSVTIPDGVTSIGSSAFNGCRGLTSIIIPDGVTSIESSAFYGCHSLTSITIPDGVTSIGGGAFYGCGRLIDIHYKGTNDQWCTIKKGTDWNTYTANYTIHCTDGDISKS